jgi:hypothetical protein
MTGDRACLVVTDSDGTLLLTKTYDGESGDGGKWFTRAYSLVETIANHFYMVGTHDAGGKKYQLLLANSVLATDDTPPTIIVLSPENNRAYPSDDVQLTFYVSKPTLFLWYSLDGQNATLSGNTTLPTLADGQHNITVYARDTSYNVGTSEPVFFSSETIYFTTEAAITIAQPDDTSSGNTTLDSLQLVLIVTATITAAALAAATFIYYRKHKTRK